MPAATQLPTKEQLDELFDYRDGALYWRKSSSTLAPAGSKAGCVNGRGYLVVGINYKKYLVHRLIWVMHGNDPVAVLDHINGDTTDNRIENLRASTHTENMCNARRSKRNTSGVKGVSWSKTMNKWVGSVWFKRKIYTTQPFEQKDQCAEAVKALRSELHGEFARHT